MASCSVWTWLTTAHLGSAWWPDLMSNNTVGLTSRFPGVSLRTHSSVATAASWSLDEQGHQRRPLLKVETLTHGKGTGFARSELQELKFRVPLFDRKPQPQDPSTSPPGPRKSEKARGGVGLEAALGHLLKERQGSWWGKDRPARVNTVWPLSAGLPISPPP